MQTVQNSHFNTRFWRSIFSTIRWTLKLSNPLFEILLKCNKRPAKELEVKSLVGVSKTSKFPKRSSLLAADISLHFSRCNFQTAGTLELQEVFLETRFWELSFRCWMTPFGQVFWKICSLEVEAAILKSTSSFYFCFCTCYFLVPLPPIPFGRLFGLVFHWFLLIV